MRLNSNMASLNLYNNYKKNLSANKGAIDKLSSGTKLNSAKDNPNKIGQSEDMRIKIKSLQSAQRNLQDASSMLQTADGALQEVNNMLGRMKELSVQAGNDTLTLKEREIIQGELDSLISGIDDIATNTEFNGNKLLKDERVPHNDYPVYKDIVVGAFQGEQSRIPMFNVSTEVLKDKNGNELRDIKVTSNEKSSEALIVIEESIKTVSSIRSKYGAIINRLDNTAENLSKNQVVMERASSGLMDADIAKEMAELARTQILNDSSLALISQSNNIPQEALRILERVK